LGGSRRRVLDRRRGIAGRKRTRTSLMLRVRAAAKLGAGF
jgi:hypothetical protein